MKAIRVHEFGPPEVMKYEEAETPRPGPGQVLISVKAVGVNPVDTYIRAGGYGARAFPFTPGLDAAGVVEAVGEGVEKFSPGDRVYTSGTITGAYAEKTLCKETQAHKLPEKATFAQGASLGVPFATAYRAIFQRAKALPGEFVLVHGASGGVGVASVQIARAAGMKVIGTTGTERGRALALKEGAHFVVDHTRPDHMDEVMRLTGGNGADVIIEFLANINLASDLKTIAKGGRIVVVGCRGKIEIDPRESMGKDGNILGMSLFNATEKELFSIHSALAAGLENGTLRPIVGKEMELKDAVAAHHAILEERAYGKIILVP